VGSVRNLDEYRLLRNQQEDVVEAANEPEHIYLSVGTDGRIKIQTYDGDKRRARELLIACQMLVCRLLDSMGDPDAADPPPI
jgi:hypothetical protein